MSLLRETDARPAEQYLVGLTAGDVVLPFELLFYVLRA
jgi:hypothetical protein